MEFGKTLRQAREAKGYTISQLADMTRVMSQVIEGLENEDFKKIAAPIYGRGFVKLCCQALDLDPKPMVDEFMALYTGEKPVAIANPIKPPTAETPVTPETPPRGPVGADEVPVRDPQRDLFEQPIPTPPPVKTLSRFAPPTPDESLSKPSVGLPAIPWRLVALLAAAVAIVWIVIVGCGSLYRSLSAPDQDQVVSRPVAVAEPGDAAKADDAPKAPRTAKPVKPLYID